MQCEWHNRTIVAASHELHRSNKQHANADIARKLTRKLKMDLLQRRLFPEPAAAPAPDDVDPEELVADGGSGWYVQVANVVTDCLPTSAHVSGTTYPSTAL